MSSGDPAAATVYRTSGASDRRDGRGGDSTDDPASGIVPTDLRGVGSGTAAIIKGSAFDAADIVRRDVSYTMLLDAGVNRRIADILRREYSLVWSFYWTDGADLRRRAAELSGLGEAEREWIAASAPDERRGDAAGVVRIDDAEWTRRDDRSDPAASDGEHDEPNDATAEADACPRCGAELTTYSFGGRETTACEACGYADIDVG